MLWDLLRCARDANTVHGVTGMLLYRDGTFIQTIEGADYAIGQLYKNISADPHHHMLIKMIDAVIDRRAFTNWSMGFYDLRAAREHEAGFTDFLRLWPDAAAGKALTPPESLLASFRDNNR